MAESRHLANPSKVQLKRIYERFSRKPNVVACYLGFKYSKGRRRRTIAIVCLVSTKKRTGSLRARDRIPKSVSWKTRSGRQHQIATDVVKLRGPGTLCATTGPGDGCSIVEAGSVGLAMRHPSLGNVVTSAGHCALRADEPAGNYDFSADPRQAVLRNLASATSHGGQALAASCTSVADYALVRPDDPSGCTNFHRSGVRVRPPPQSDPPIGASVTLLTSTGASKMATLVGMHGQMPIGRAGLMVDVILTTPTLRGGDSGGLLTLSQTREAFGLAVGFVPVASRRIISVFMPAASVLKREAGSFL